jgi:hypothetical protein
MATTYEEKFVPITSLLLDPNNFRFQDEPDYLAADPARFAEPSVQERAAKRIRGEGLVELKSSIVSNGFLSVERLVVRKYKELETGGWLYLVLEGNRRLGRVSQSLVAVFGRLGPCLVPPCCLTVSGLGSSR